MKLLETKFTYYDIVSNIQQASVTNYKTKLIRLYYVHGLT